MAIMEQDVLMYDEDSSGNVSFQLPITRWGLVEDGADVKTTPTSGDYVPVFDGANGGRAKKVAWEAFIRQISDDRISALEERITSLENCVNCLDTMPETIAATLSYKEDPTSSTPDDTYDVTFTKQDHCGLYEITANSGMPIPNFLPNRYDNPNGYSIIYIQLPEGYGFCPVDLSSEFDNLEINGWIEDVVVATFFNVGGCYQGIPKLVYALTEDVDNEPQYLSVGGTVRINRV